MQGKVIKGIGGFYYVKPFDSSFLSEKIIECKPRGLLRYQKISPVVGDIVELEADKNGDYSITAIAERDNELVRPPVSNVTHALICISTDNPKPNLLVLDKLIANTIFNHIEPVICITKMDLDKKTGETIKQIYSKAGLKVLSFSNSENDDLGECTTRWHIKSVSIA